MDTAILHLSAPEGSINDNIRLTGSKSESNRALIIQALFENVGIVNLSEAEDTATLAQALAQVKQHDGENVLTVDIGPAGTAMRFLTAFLSLQQGRYHLTGSTRMQQRPIRILVDALNSIGASISYVNQSGFPPLLINGGFTQASQEVDIQGDVSSQYLSALLLIAPSLQKGLNMHIIGELTSRPYVGMTLAMLAEAGISHQWEGNTISIPKQSAAPSTLYIEPDWSAASYWYSIIALSPIGSTLVLPGLKSDSLQGDRAIVDIMANFGVRSTFGQEGLKIEKVAAPAGENMHFDLKECPDLAQTVIVCAAALHCPASFTGLETLKIKETDRIKALQNELGKFGVTLEENQQLYHLHTENMFTPEALQISTYEDHRMAMAFAPLALLFRQLRIEDPAVVGKSYPLFWKHLEQIGFKARS